MITKLPCKGCYSYSTREGCYKHKDNCPCVKCLIKMVCNTACDNLKQTRLDEIGIDAPCEGLRVYNWKKENIGMLK